MIIHANAHDTKEKIPLRDVARLALKVIFEDHRISGNEVAVLNCQVKNWNDLIQFQKKLVADKYGLDSTAFVPIGKKGSIIDEWEFFLQIICSWLVKNERGEFDKLKGLWKQHGINYKKTTRFGWLFPEMYTKEGYAKAREALAQHMKTNPEDYN